jgi:hypothetical protein
MIDPAWLSQLDAWGGCVTRQFVSRLRNADGLTGQFLTSSHLEDAQILSEIVEPWRTIGLGILGGTVAYALLAACLRCLRAARQNRAARLRPCRSCGYDLRGNTSGVCPECGNPMPSDAGGRPVSAEPATQVGLRALAMGLSAPCISLVGLLMWMERCESRCQQEALERSMAYLHDAELDSWFAVDLAVTSPCITEAALSQDALLDVLAHGALETETRFFLGLSLARICPRRTGAVLRDMYDGASERTERRQLLSGIGFCGQPEDLRLLEDVLTSDSDMRLRSTAARALAEQGVCAVVLENARRPRAGDDYDMLQFEIARLQCGDPDARRWIEECLERAREARDFQLFGSSFETLGYGDVVDAVLAFEQSTDR